MSWDSGAATGGGEWNDGPAAAGVDDFGGGETNGFSGGDNGAESGAGGGFSGGCFNCGVEGHSKSECPEPPKPRPCFNCNQEGKVLLP